jgi:ferredoxin-NADP reductase/dephospho-CoA kinase
MIIGLTGRNASGKGVALEYLKSRGFAAHSLSDVIREEVRRRGEPMSRDTLLAAGRELRTRHGNGVLAERILGRLEPGQNAVVDSFRHEDEVKAFRKAPDFHLLALRADARTRFERIRERKRENDPQTYEAFVELEGKEATRQAEGGQDLTATEALADHVLENDGTVAELHARLAALVSELLGRMRRPGWDEYFMKIAQVVALRGNCAKRKVAAVIVRDRRVVSTGYNGTPRGTTNCYEGGLPALQRDGRERDPAGGVPLLPRGGERHHAGGLPRGEHPRGHPLLHLRPLPDVHQDDHQRRHPGSDLQPGLPPERNLLRPDEAGGRHLPARPGGANPVEAKAMEELNCVVTSTIRVSPLMRILRVKPVGWTLPEYKPGQFVPLGLPPEAARYAEATEEHAAPPEGRLIKRAYSIASSSTQEYVEFYISVVHSGSLTPRIFALEINDKIWMGKKAAGMFTLDEVDEEKNVILIATGTGVAPYMSMLRSNALRRKGRILVVHGASNSWDLGYKSELELLDSMMENFSYHPTITLPDKEPAGWKGDTRFVEAIWKDGTVAKRLGAEPTPDTTHIFLCGNPKMVEGMKATCEQSGFRVHSKREPGQIHFENFG